MIRQQSKVAAAGFYLQVLRLTLFSKLTKCDLAGLNRRPPWLSLRESWLPR